MGRLISSAADDSPQASKGRGSPVGAGESVGANSQEANANTTELSKLGNELYIGANGREQKRKLTR